MFCQNCGSNVNEGAAFCPNCGKGFYQTNEALRNAYVQPAAMPQRTTYRRGMERRLQFMLAVVIGYMLYQALAFFVQLSSASFGGAIALASFSANRSLLSMEMVIALVIEGIILFAVDHRDTVSQGGLIVGLSMEMLLIIAAFAFPVGLQRALHNSTELFDMGSTFLRAFAGAALAGTVIAALLGFTLKKDSIKYDLIIIGSTFFLVLIIGIVGIFFVHGGIWVFGIVIGFMHPMVTLIPCAGRKPLYPAGNTIENEASYAAPYTPQSAVYQSYGSYVNPADSPSFGFGVLGFFFPVVGFILWLVWHDSFPQRSRSVGVGALIGIILVILGAVLNVLLVVGGVFLL